MSIRPRCKRRTILPSVLTHETPRILYSLQHVQKHCAVWCPFTHNAATDRIENNVGRRFSTSLVHGGPQPGSANGTSPIKKKAFGDMASARGIKWVYSINEVPTANSSPAYRTRTHIVYCCQESSRLAFHTSIWVKAIKHPTSNLRHSVGRHARYSWHLRTS